MLHRIFIAGVIILASSSRSCLLAQVLTATLHGSIFDETGQPTPARVWVKSTKSRFFRPVDVDNIVYERDGSFSCSGSFTIKLPSGDAVVHVERGKEFLPARQRIALKPGDEVEEKITIKRWVNLPSEGYYSTDMHVHFGHDNIDTLKQLALADDVHLLPAFSYWLRGTGETWLADWPPGVDTRPIQVDDSHLVTRNNIEVERIIRRDAPAGSTAGATFFFNLKHAITADSYGEHFPADAALAMEARRHSPHAVFDSDKPSWAETVIGVALNGIDTIQVCHNHYHRNSTLPGGYGMIGPLAVGESNAADLDGLFHRTNNLYYRLLNCGFRLGVSGGSAIGVMPVPTGFNRVYAHVEGEFTAEKLWAAVKNGKSFATTGPILLLTANGRPMGDTIELQSGDGSELQVEMHLRSIERIEAVQLIHNGAIVQSTNLSSVEPSLVLDRRFKFTLKPDLGGWLAARAVYRNANNELRQAHTSPIYFNVDGKGFLNGDDLRYMLRWIDVLVDHAHGDAKQFPSEQDRTALLSIYAKARGVYADRLKRAK